MTINAPLHRVINVSLTVDECILVEQIVNNRYARNRGNGKPDELTADRDPIENDIEAFGAELAVCKHFNIYPDLTWTHATPFDIMIKDQRVDVKKVFGQFMNVRKTRKSEKVDYYVGVGGKYPNYKIIGALSSDRVKSYELQSGRKNTEYWSVPIDHLLEVGQ